MNDLKINDKILNKFVRGFVFSKEEISISEFKSLKVGEYNLYYDGLLNVSLKETKKGFLLLLGTVLDIRDDNSSIERVISTLVSAANNNTLYEEIDYLAGRYVLIYKDGLDVKALSDATGMKSIFYLEDYSSIASHANLLTQFMVEIIDSDVEKFRKEHKISYQYGYPGFLTPIKNCLILMPNFEINLTKRYINRFYPRKELAKNLDTNDLIIEINHYMKNQISSLIGQNKNIYCSLTAGLNSRYTLSATKEFKDIHYLTYFYRNNRSHNSDLIFSKLIANILNLNHKVLDIDECYNFDSKEFKGYASMLSQNSIYSPHSRKISYAYFKEFGNNNNNILIRSNLYEIGRAFYQSYIDDGSFEDYSNDENYLGGIFLKLYNKNISHNEMVKNAFVSYAKYCTREQLFNYEPMDIFYWEHRMGLWHSHVVLESDPVFETIILCNARKIFELFLSVSLSDRKSSMLFKQAINQYIPELKNVPINKQNITEYDRFHVIADIQEDSLVVNVYHSDDVDYREYAYYVYLDGKIIHKERYSQDSVFSYQLKKSGKYYVRAFVKNNGEPKANNSNAVNYLGGVTTISLDELEDQFSIGKNNIEVGNYIFETFYKKGSSNKLVILLNGAAGDRSKAKLPMFQRNSWAGDIDDHVLNINDPTLYLDNNLRLGWYYGTSTSPLVHELKKLIATLTNILNVNMKDVVLYGSSGGGFAALNIASYIGDGIKAVAINPQVYLSQYISKETVRLFYKTCVLNGGKPNISLEKQLQDSMNTAFYLIYQNKYDIHHYKIHFQPLLKSLNIEENVRDGHFQSIVFEDERGHVGENRSVFSNLIETVRNMDSSI